MENVTVEDNKCVIRINSEIYPPPIVFRAVNDFKVHGDIAVENKNTKVVITPNSGKNIEEIGYLFFDYLLSIIQNENW